MTKAQTKNTESDVSTRSIEQWDNEGGSMPCGYGPVTTVSSPGSPLLGDANQSEKLTFAEEEQILERLGAAVTMKWETLPRKTQRELFDYATSLADAMDKVQFTGQIARFLHGRKRYSERMSARLL